MYVQYFKLKGKPFGLNPDPKFFFNSSTHKRALSCLGYGLGQGQGFVVITGDSGTGKTTLMSALLHMLAQTNIITARVINTQLQCDDMLRYVAAELGLPYEDLSKVTLLKSIESFMEKCRSNGKRIIIIIDEAQNLSESAIEELRMLMNLVTGNEALLQFVLLGQTRLQEQLYTEALEPLRQRIVTSYHLGSLDEEETRAYIIQRLRTVGWVGDPEFSPGAYLAIHEYAHGVPAKINMLCGKVLQAACLNDSHELLEEDVLNIIRELNHNFSEQEFSGSIVEGVIDALQAKQSSVSTVAKTVEQIKPEGVVEETVEETIELIDTPKEEKIEIIDVENNSNQEDLPVVSEQITIDQALLETDQLQASEKADGEIHQWLQEQKQRINTVRQDQVPSELTRTSQTKEKERTSEHSDSYSEDLPLSNFEDTIEESSS